MDEFEIRKWIQNHADFFNSFLKETIIPDLQEQTPATLAQAIAYCLDAPGKRIRPLLCLSAAGIQTTLLASSQNALLVATALECTHTYSLIHDDLPAMDDDDLRRGRPTAHIKFGEWVAILAGDALNTYAFELLTRVESKHNLVGRLVRILSQSAGMQNGMIAGQALDLFYERQQGSHSDADSIAILKNIHIQKTARLISAACEMGALIGGYEESICALYKDYGLKLGLLFQITDDLLDFSGDEKIMGKAVQKDIARGKWTYPGLLGLDKTREHIDVLCHSLDSIADKLESQSKMTKDHFLFWKQLPIFIRNRNK